MLYFEMQKDAGQRWCFDFFTTVCILPHLMMVLMNTKATMSKVEPQPGIISLGESRILVESYWIMEYYESPRTIK